jgi:hypothetical protein
LTLFDYRMSCFASALLGEQHLLAQVLGPDACRRSAKQQRKLSKEAARLILAEIETPRRIAAEWVFDEPLMTTLAEVESESLRGTVFEFAFSGRFHFLDELGNLLEMICVEILFVQLFRIESGINFHLRYETPVTQLLPTKIAREVQHNNRILPELGMAIKKCQAIPTEMARSTHA